MARMPCAGEAACGAAMEELMAKSLPQRGRRAESRRAGKERGREWFVAAEGGHGGAADDGITGTDSPSSLKNGGFLL